MTVLRERKASKCMNDSFVGRLQKQRWAETGTVGELSAVRATRVARNLESDPRGLEEPQRRGQPHEDQPEEGQPACDGDHPRPKTLSSEQEHLGHEHAVEEASEQGMEQHPRVSGLE